MDKPIKQYIQDLMIDTVNTVRHLDTTDILYKSLLIIIKQDVSIHNPEDIYNWEHITEESC